MQRFLHGKYNVTVLKNLQFMSCNNFAEAKDLSVYAKRMYDVISYESKSYYDEREAFKSLVGPGGDVGDVPKLRGSQPSERLCRKLSETDIVEVQASPRPARRLRTKCQPALSPESPTTSVVKTVPTEIKEVKETTNSFFVTAGCCQPEDLCLAFTKKQAQQRAAILLKDQSESERRWTLQMDAWTERLQAGKERRCRKQREYEAGLRQAKGSRCMEYADLVKAKQEEASAEDTEEDCRV